MLSCEWLGFKSCNWCVSRKRSRSAALSHVSPSVRTSCSIKACTKNCIVGGTNLAITHTRMPGLGTAYHWRMLQHYTVFTWANKCEASKQRITYPRFGREIIPVSFYSKTIQFLVNLQSKNSHG